jgi:hypothetical protein
MPQTHNEVWGKLSKGTVSLSPYATWEVQLVPKDPTDEDAFLRLTLPVDEDRASWLELNGYASYVTPNAIRVADLKKYYGQNML